MTARMLILVLVVLAGVPQATAGDDPLRYGLDRLEHAINDLGTPSAGEVASERAELAGVLAGLQRRARDTAAERASVDAEQDRLDRRSRERDSRLEHVELDQKALDGELANFMRRANALKAEAAEQRSAASVVTTDEAYVARINAWGRSGDARIAAMTREGRLLDERRTAIEGRRAEIASDLIDHARRARWVQKYRARVDRETAAILGACASALSRAFALAQIMGSPSRAIAYESPRALADKVAGDLFKGIAKDAAVTGLKGETMLALLAKIGLEGLPVGLLFTVADTFADVALVGVDQRTRQVTKNLFLIGDYGAVMKKLIQTKGARATQDPEYRAMRAQIDRLAADMPSSDAQLLLRGLGDSAALGTALVAVAGHYAGKGVERATAGITNHLSNVERATLGKGGVVLFRESFKALGSFVGSESTKLSAQAIADATRLVNEHRAKP